MCGPEVDSGRMPAGKLRGMPGPYGAAMITLPRKFPLR